MFRCWLFTASALLWACLAHGEITITGPDRAGVGDDVVLTIDAGVEIDAGQKIEVLFDQMKHLAVTHEGEPLPVSVRFLFKDGKISLVLEAIATVTEPGRNFFEVIKWPEPNTAEITEALEIIERAKEKGTIDLDVLVELLTEANEKDGARDRGFHVVQVGPEVPPVPPIPPVPPPGDINWVMLLAEVKDISDPAQATAMYKLEMYVKDNPKLTWKREDPTNPPAWAKPVRAEVAAKGIKLPALVVGRSSDGDEVPKVLTIQILAPDPVEQLKGLGG